MQQILLSSSILFGLFIGMYICLRIGNKLGARRKAAEFKVARHGISVMEGAVFALMGLLVAFTFSDANNRFEMRRHQVIDEVNAISTAYMRIDLLNFDSQQALRENFRQYVKLRLAVYQEPSASNLAKRAVVAVNNQQQLIWQQMMTALENTRSPSAHLLLVPALNEMFDIANGRIIGAAFHMPFALFFLLIALAFTSALLAGYDLAGNQKPPPLHMLGFMLILTLTIYLIIDFEFSGMGLIEINPYNQELVRQLNKM